MVTMTAYFPISRVNFETSRQERLENLRRYFLCVLVENPQGYTPFDYDVLTMIERLGETYYDSNENPSSAFDSETEIAKEQRIDEILTASHKKAITEEESNELRELLREKYYYGDLLQEHRCPKCDHPLLFSWSKGVICLWSKSGCGWQLVIK